MLFVLLLTLCIKLLQFLINISNVFTYAIFFRQLLDIALTTLDVLVIKFIFVVKIFYFASAVFNTLFQS